MERNIKLIQEGNSQKTISQVIIDMGLHVIGMTWGDSNHYLNNAHVYFGISGNFLIPSIEIGLVTIKSFFSGR